MSKSEQKRLEAQRNAKEDRMKITLEYDGFEEWAEALDAQHAVDYLVALDKIEAEVRRLWKYTEFDCDETFDTIDELWGYVQAVLAELPGYER